MDIPYEVDGARCNGFLALPAGAGAVPGVIVLHGGSGLGDHARQRARMLADLGYAAFAPDLFGRRIEGLEAAEAATGEFLGDWARLCRSCDAAFRILAGHERVEAGRIAAIGFCFGGQVALEYARSGANMRAVIGFHSRLATRYPERSGAISAKVLICLGDADRFVSRAEREHFLNDMRANGVDCQMLLFSGVNHSFTDRYAEVSGVPGLKYDARADGRAWAAMQALLAEAFADTPQA
ncbi:MAG: dienelactone hydrolase family protein [Novosphingobium sp.]